MGASRGDSHNPMARTDAQLIQIYASADSATRCGLLTVEQLRAGSVCGPLNQ
jgi:hypothetical protein